MDRPTSRVSLQFKGSLQVVDPLWSKAELFKMVQSVGDTDWSSYTKEDILPSMVDPPGIWIPERKEKKRLR